MIKIDHSSITMRQLFFSVACFIQSSALLTAFFTAVTDQDSWMSAIIGILVTIPVMLLFSKLMKMYPDKTVLGICCEVFGKTVGKVLSVYYLAFFLILGSLNLGDLGSFVQVAMMPITPTLLVVSAAMFVCSMAIKGGAQIVCRYSMLFTAIALVVIFVGTVLSLPLWHLDYFLPMFNLPAMKYVQAVHVINAIPLSETVVFLMFTPSLSKNKSKLSRTMILALLFGAINLLIVVIRNAAILDNITHLITLPPFEIFRLINFSTALSRMEILFAVSLMTLLFFKICVIFYAAVMAFAETFGLKSYKSIVYLVGALIVALSFNLYDSNVDHGNSARQYTPFYWMIPELIIPVALLIGGTIKQKKKQKQNAPSDSPAQQTAPAEAPAEEKAEAAQQ